MYSYFENDTKILDVNIHKYIYPDKYIKKSIFITKEIT